MNSFGGSVAYQQSFAPAKSDGSLEFNYRYAHIALLTYQATLSGGYMPAAEKGQINVIFSFGFVIYLIDIGYMQTSDHEQKHFIMGSSLFQLSESLSDADTYEIFLHYGVPLNSHSQHHARAGVRCLLSFI